MSNRRTTTSKTLERELLQAAVRRDGAAIKRAVVECQRQLTHADTAELLRRMAFAVGVFAARVPESDRQQVASQLVNADAIIALLAVTR